MADRIVCAAVRTPDGRIGRGMTHDEAWEDLVSQLTPDDVERVADQIVAEGFIARRDSGAEYFVDREHALALARAARQVRSESHVVDDGNELHAYNVCMT